jgi:MFS transporter, DHA1 family, multidrug resistance protein
MEKKTAKNGGCAFFSIFMRQGPIIPIAISLPAIKQHFHATMTHTQWTTSAFIVATAVMNLVYGALTDRFGRKYIEIIGLFLLFLGSILCMFASSIEQLFVFRIIQGLGFGIEFTVSASILVDLVKTKNGLAQLYSCSEFIYGISNISFAFIGGWLQTQYGWSGNFTMIGIYAVLLAIGFLFFFTETSPKVKKPHISIFKYFLNYFKLFKDLKHVFLVFSLGMTSAFMAVFYATTPFYVQDFLKVSVGNYGLFLTVMSVIYMIGVFINILFLTKFKPETICKFGGLLFLIAFISMFAQVLVHVTSYTYFIISAGIFMMYISFCYANLHSIICNRYPEIAGTINSSIAFIFLFLGATITAIVGLFPNFNSLTLVTGILGVVGFCIMLLFFISLTLKPKKVLN